MVVCPTCGTPNEPDALFCERDGTPLKPAAPTAAPTPVPAAVEAPQPLPSANGYLILPDQTELMLSQASRTFGRSDLIRFLKEEHAQEVSRAHFTIMLENGKYYLQDGGPDPNNPQAWKPSVNHTSLNGTVLQPDEKTPLKANDIIDVAGLVQLTFKTR